MSRQVDEHRLYLSDERRVAAYGAAIAAAVRPGDVVVDLGSGTGILGLLACRAGAARVYAIDAGGMADPARAIAHANGLDDRLHVIDGFSRDVDLPERAHVLVADQIGHFGFEAGIVGYVADARRRLLVPGGRLVPSRIDLWVAPIESPEIGGAVEFWTRDPGGFDMRPLHAIAANSGHPRALDARELLAPAVCGGTIDLAADVRSISLAGETVIARAGTLHGIAGWFDAELFGGIRMTNSPLDAGRIARRGVVFPITEPLPVAPGDRLHVEMRILPDDLIVSWSGALRRPDGSTPRRFKQSTLHGMLIPDERLRRTRPDFVPRLTARGRARLSVLELCDGRRSLAEIESQVFERHVDLFRTRDEAAVFVAEVVTGYSE